MKKLIFIVSIFFLLLIYFNNNVFASVEKTTPYIKLKGYDLYLDRNKLICDKYKYIQQNKNNDKIDFVLNIPLDYLKIDNSNNTYNFTDIKNTHISNMNNIYKCGLLNIQKKSFNLIQNDLIKTNPSLAKRMDGKITSNIRKVDYQIKALKCNNPKDKNSIQKINVLNQVTYQTCKYINYLEYLKEYHQNISNTLGYSQNNNKLHKQYNIGEVFNKQSLELNKINSEINHIYKVFPLAFQAYTEYENNITIHFLLELIKSDYIVLRQKLHKALNPINQVVYKISNAMRK